MTGRVASITRKSAETSIELRLDLDGNGQIHVKSGYAFFDHMLTLTAFWANFNLDLLCQGDLQVDAHHSVEDCGLCLGAALLKALGDRKGIERVGFGRVPMDEALTEVSIDLSGRSWLEWRGSELLPPYFAGEESDLWREYYKSVANAAHMNLHVNFLYGKNGHHLLESVAKGFGLALKQGVKITSDFVRSTKGGLD